MKALILAAGLGTRLAPLTNEVPKSMVEVNGKPILVKQIENLLNNGVEDITIITGYKSHVIENLVKEYYPNIKIIESVDYEKTNNMYSAYLARNVLQGEDFLMMNADVYYDEEIITELLDEKYENAIVTDIGSYSDESMKVIFDGNRITAISKQITKEEALGNSIDVYKFSKEAGKAFFEKCKEYIEEKQELKMWSEVALNAILDEVSFVPCPLKGRWVEIDNHDDLRLAEELFKDEKRSMRKYI